MQILHRFSSVSFFRLQPCSELQAAPYKSSPCVSASIEQAGTKTTLPLLLPNVWVTQCGWVLQRRWHDCSRSLSSMQHNLQITVSNSCHRHMVTLEMPWGIWLCMGLALDARRSKWIEACEVQRTWTWSHRTEFQHLPRWNSWQMPIQQQTLHKAGPINNLKSSAGTKEDKCSSQIAKYLLHISVAERLSYSSLSCINLLNKLC